MTHLLSSFFSFIRRYVLLFIGIVLMLVCAFGEWSGGWLGVLTRQMEDFGSWHRSWYIDDLAASIKGGAAHAN